MKTSCSVFSGSSLKQTPGSEPAVTSRLSFSTVTWGVTRQRPVNIYENIWTMRLAGSSKNAGKFRFAQQEQMPRSQEPIGSVDPCRPPWQSLGDGGGGPGPSLLSTTQSECATWFIDVTGSSANQLCAEKVWKPAVEEVLWLVFRPV